MMALDGSAPDRQTSREARLVIYSLHAVHTRKIITVTACPIGVRYGPRSCNVLAPIYLLISALYNLFVCLLNFLTSFIFS